MRIIFIMLFGLLFLTSCKQESSKLFESKSSDGQIVVIAQGKRYFSADPWKVDINMTVKEKTRTAEIEIQAGELTDENVKFTWKSENECIISFTQRNGEVVSVPISVHGL